MSGLWSSRDGERSAMARETAQSPDVVARICAARGELEALVSYLRRKEFDVAVICGRGSSGHVGVLLRYLIETRIGVPVSATAPSIVTSYKRKVALSRALFIVISQSGRSPDLVAATRAARREGAATLAILNDVDSPVAEAAEWVLPLRAGVEHSVAATKSVIGSMALGALLLGVLAEDQALVAALERLPARLAKALQLDWSLLGASLPSARAVFVAGRGFGFAPAREIALKMSEALRLPALAYSAAELLHGPRAAVTRETPVLALRVGDETADAVDALVANLDASSLSVHVVGGPNSRLPWIGDDHPVADAIAMLAPAYEMIERTTRAMGYDPDNPPHLKKVTETL
jgi:glutamine---fructose-6-phosphate transaminase (isomerizing)